ncbi:MAG TPA: hypothetical protein VFY68_00150 [Nitrososphaeraceae archaeon]|nr:hypothetical protein [Nitrososphaeraceae archaeon]
MLFTEIRNYDWNIVEFDVSEKHNFFEEQYEAINETIDELAESIKHLDLLIQSTMVLL